MKLRKALDKARSLRKNEVSDDVAGAGAKKAGWQAPVYDESKTSTLDPETVMENRGVCIRSDSAEIEQYKVLRTHIHHRMREKGHNAVMVTSVAPNEGKTVTAINISLTFAKELSQTVLLVDCDLKGQDIHKYLGVASENSLIDYFVDSMPINELIIWPGVEKFSFISGDRTIQDSTELLGSQAMKSLVDEMKSRYEDRYIIFDAPPILNRADAMAMAPMMDGIILVVESGVTSKREIKKAIDIMPKEKFLGFVLNKQK